MRVQVVALANGYHGDTLGVMDCCPRSVFNEGQSPWYQPRGLFLNPPTCGVTCGRWEVRAHTIDEQQSFDFSICIPEN